MWGPCFFLVAAEIAPLLLFGSPLDWYLRFLVLFALGLWFAFLSMGSYTTEPASEPCGLLKGNCYRVIKPFSAGEVSFTAGEVLVFKRALHYDATNAEDPVYDNHDIYEFEEKRIHSFEAPNLKDWVSCLEHVGEPANELVVFVHCFGHTRVAGRVESPKGKPLRRAKVTLSHNARILIGGRANTDGCFDVETSHKPSLEFVQFRVVSPGYKSYIAEVEANQTYRAPQLVLVSDDA